VRIMLTRSSARFLSDRGIDATWLVRLGVRAPSRRLLRRSVRALSRALGRGCNATYVILRRQRRVAVQSPLRQHNWACSATVQTTPRCRSAAAALV